MGTRADFYVGRGKSAEWIGSTAWDGYPDGFSDTPIFGSKTEEEFRANVAAEIGGREDGTKPEMGWPWPWDNSHTTDYSYAFDDGKVWATNWGYRWFDPNEPEPDDINDEAKLSEFPDMTDRKKLTMGKRSGVMVFSASGPITPD